MQHDDFRIADRFWTNAGEWQCTDVGTRTVVAIKIGDTDVEDVEIVFDENDVGGCYPTAAERDADLGTEHVERILIDDLDDPDGNVH